MKIKIGRRLQKREKRDVCLTQLEDLPFIEVSSQGSLRILGVQDTDAGHYECVAVNEAGTSSAVVTLDIGCTSPL